VNPLAIGPVRVNGVEIAEAAILTEMQHHPAPSAGEAMRAAAEALAVRELLLQEARLLGLDPAPEGDETGDEALVRRLIAREVASPRADAAACRRYYDNNPRRFRSPDAFDAQHILYAAPQDDPAARLAARGRAQSALECVLADPSLFEKLAREESDCPSRERGGRMGMVQRGDADPAFETYLMSLGDGEICGLPVETKYGFHVVRLLRRQEGRALPFEYVKDKIAAYLEERAWRWAVRHYVSILAGRGAVEGVPLCAASSPLAQ
jgi:peptidyl-prolyl cis-trans isomerase C